jgi:EAL domain-containing protein (putative c-di-GMP-specific phosphodiesterase class I)
MFAEYKTLPPDQQKVFREFVERLDKQGQYAISTESLQQLFASQQADTATN